MTSKKGSKTHLMNVKKEKESYLQAITIIDPTTAWIEVDSVR